MKTQVISLRILMGVVAIAMAIFVYVQPAAAATYYYPTTPTAMPYYYSYQPVYQYQYQQPQLQAQNRDQLMLQLQAMLAQLQQLQLQYRNMYGHAYTYTTPGTHVTTHGYGTYTYNNRDYDIDVNTEDARNINDDYATLYGEVDLDGAPYATVWFEYGTDGSLDEDSRKVRVTSSMNDTFAIKVDDLDEDEKYYYRAVAEDPNGERVYGYIDSFEADDYSGSSNDDEKPDVTTGDADEVTDDSVEFNGEVDMNDFDNGDVFFVYGEDESQVEDVEDEDSYADVDEDGDDLQKYKVYNDLDHERDFWLDVYGLDDNTDYYYRICVEYEDEDGDDTLECGDVEHFETDN